MSELSAVQFPNPPAVGGLPPGGLRHVAARVRARVRRSSLDGALAAGADPCGSLALACRAARLTSRKTRERLAASVEGVLAAATRPPRAFSSAVEPHRAEVVAAGALLVQVEELLRSTTPVYSHGVAMLEQLLGDGGSPLYLPARRGALTETLELIIAALEGRQNLDDQWAVPADYCGRRSLVSLAHWRQACS